MSKLGKYLIATGSVTSTDLNKSQFRLAYFLKRIKYYFNINN